MYILKKLIKYCRNASALQIVLLAPYSLFVSSVSVSLVVLLQMFLQKGSPYSTTLLRISAIGLISALVLAVVLRWLPPISGATKSDTAGLKAYLLAIHVGVLLAFIPVFLLVWRSADETTVWYVYPELVNKKWIFGFYWIALLTFLVLPHLVRRLMEIKFVDIEPKRPRRRAARYPENAPGGRVVPLAQETTTAQPPEASSIQEVSGISADSRLRSGGRIVAKVLLAAGIALFLFGPPWNLERHHRGIDFHEQLHLGLLQALHKGQLIDVGQAATAYGPGSQLVTYEFMERTGHFNIVGYREAGAFIHLVTTFVFCLTAFLLLGVGWGLVAVLFGLAYSPLHFFMWQEDGTLGGFHGWGNGFRYLGTAVVLPGLAILARSRWNLRFPAWPATALGLISGLFCWLSQENLSTTALAGGVLLCILWLTETTSLEGILKLTGNMLCGFAAFWVPVLLYYAVHGVLGEFVRAYFLYPSTVFQGYSNNYWSSGAADPQAKVFHFMVLFLILVGVCTLTEIPGFRLRRRLDARKSLLLAFLLALAASYPTSLFRSDSSHLMNTTIALPFVLVLALRDLPDSFSRRWPIQGAWRVALVAMAFYFFPLRPFFGDILHQVVQAPLSRFVARSEPPGPPPDNRVPFQRATQYLCDEPQVCNGNVPMRQFLEEASAVHDLIGTRRTYVQDFPGTYTGFLYFMLDLNPAPYLLDRSMMIINSKLEAEALEYFKRHVQECEAIIAIERDIPEIRLFLQAHPNATTMKRFLGDRPYYLVLAPGDASPIAHP